MNPEIFDTPERGETIAEVISHLGAGRNVAVAGEPRFGKTLILKNISRRLADDPLFIPILFNIVYEPVKPFGERYVLHLLRALGYPVAGAMTNGYGYDYQIIAELLAQAKSSHPEVAALCDDILHEEGILEKIRKIFLSAGKMSHILDRKVVFLIDDFSRIGSYKVPGIFKAIRETLELPGAGLCVAADTIEGFNHVLLRPRTILKPNFTKVELRPLTAHWVERIIREQYLMTADMSPSLITFFVELIGGNPHYLDTIMGEITSRSIREVTSDIVFASLNDILLAPGGALGFTIRDRIFSSLDIRGYSTFVTILKLLAQGKRTVSEISYAIGLSMPSLTYYLTRLIRKDLIVKRRNKYEVKDRLVAFWLKSGYAASLYGDLLDGKTRDRFFRSEFDTELARYVDLSTAHAYDRTVERISRLAAFEEIRPGAIIGIRFDLIAKSGANIWLVDIVKDDIGPLLIDEFRIKVAKVKEVFTVEKSILVALAVVSAPARKYCELRGIELWQGSE